MSQIQQEQAVQMKVAVIYNGQTREFPYHPNQRVEHVLKEARQAFGITVSPHLMGLFDLAGVELNDAQTLHEAGVQAGQELILRQSIVRGG
jgi:hypothetical protein